MSERGAFRDPANASNVPHCPRLVGSRIPGHPFQDLDAAVDSMVANAAALLR
jgi:hypothetical protein